MFESQKLCYKLDIFFLFELIFENFNFIYISYLSSIYICIHIWKLIIESNFIYRDLSEDDAEGETKSIILILLKYDIYESKYEIDEKSATKQSWNSHDPKYDFIDFESQKSG